MTRLAALAATVLAVTGCAVAGRYRLVDAPARDMAGAYTVEPGRAWSSYETGKVETWTIDGPALGRLRFFRGIADGESLLGAAAGPGRSPRFRAGMAPIEIVELVVDTLYGSRHAPRRVRPAPFGGAPGFRFEMSYASDDGVRREAMVAGAVLDRTLHLIVYDGTALHHFERYRADAERVLASVRLRGAPR
jgi:hypothetical protein